MSAAPDPRDVQAIVDRGFGSLDGACYLLLRVTDAVAVRGWLRGLQATSLQAVRDERQACVTQIAFTAAGLRALGLPVDAIDGFAPEFLDGMTGDAARSRRLGDLGPNAPEDWAWGWGDDEPHVLVILLASAARLDEEQVRALAGMPADAGEIVAINRAVGQVDREPFGFVDGISQPEVDWDGTLEPGGAGDRLYRNRLAAGEFLLGHANEYGFVADYPTWRDLGRNGSYLVYRQLEQDVRGFWHKLVDEAGEGGAVALAERMVGRRRDGDPLPGLGAERNAFTFAADPDGVACPIGAHIRRANPRSGDDPNGKQGFLRDLVSSLGFTGTVAHDAVASARFHRLLRRGRAYGPRLTPAEAMRGSPPEPAGLHFLCLNASLARQFEFVQGAWIASAYFGGLSAEQDPLLGNRLPDNGGRATDAFAYRDAAGEPRLCSGLPAFVTVKGGAYFFLPGLRGLATILAEGA